MSDCCDTPDNKNKKLNCSECGHESLTVSNTTVNLHLKKPWANPIESLSYYFCSNPNCEVVYFASDNSVIKQSEVRTLIGIKNQKSDSLQEKALICYCFDISYKEALKNSKLMQYVIEKTKNKECACDSQNPSGRCCLVDFKRQLT